MIHQPRHLRLLSSHWAILGEAMVVVVIVRIGLTTVGQDRVRQWRIADFNTAKAGIGVDPKPVVWAVRQAARLIPRASCLTQAIAGQTMLARRGLAANVRIGVRCGPTGAFEAHSWLVQNDVIMLGAMHEPGPPFVTIAELRPSLS